MGQSWLDLLFVHWAVPEAALRPAVPDVAPDRHVRGLGVDRRRAVRDRRAAPARAAAAAVAVALPRAQRAHVRHARRRARASGSSASTPHAPAAVVGARLTYRLPTATRGWRSCAPGGRIDYRSRRRSGAAPASRRTRPTGRRAQRGARHARALPHRALLPLRARPPRPPRRTDIHHAPWPLQPARAEMAENTMTEPLGIRRGRRAAPALRRPPGRLGLAPGAVRLGRLRGEHAHAGTPYLSAACCARGERKR